MEKDLRNLLVSRIGGCESSEQKTYFYFMYISLFIFHISGPTISLIEGRILKGCPMHDEVEERLAVFTGAYSRYAEECVLTQLLQVFCL